MIRFLLVVLFVISFLILSIPLLIAEWIIGKRNPKVKGQSSLRIVQWAFRRVIDLSGTDIHVVGRENIPDDRPVLYVGNHRSYFDIVIGYTLIKRECGFVAKKEMERYPLLSSWMRNLHCLFLDRENVREGLKTILTGIDYIKNDIASIWIFPEGTRCKTDEMLPFKEGSLKFAEKTGCPIIPVAIDGCRNIFEAQFPKIRKATVTVTFGTPIDVSTLDKEEKKFLGAYTRQVITEMLRESNTPPQAQHSTHR